MMVDSQALTWLACFVDLPDPRIDRCKDHLLIDTLFIAVCSLICGGEDFTDQGSSQTALRCGSDKVKF